MINLRYHHISLLYSHLCLTLEERARTPEFNNPNVYGLSQSIAMYHFVENLLQQPDETQIRIVGGLDDICNLPCNHLNPHCYSEDTLEDYTLAKTTGIKPGIVVQLGMLKKKLLNYAATDTNPYKETEWQTRLQKFPHLQEFTLENFWLFKYLQQNDLL